MNQPQPSQTEFDACISQLPAKDQSFAKDLSAKWTRLSFKQQYWVGVLFKRTTEAPAEPVKVGAIGGIRKMFDTASKRLKYPKIWLGTVESPIRLSLAGPNSRHHGSIMVTDGRPFGSNSYYGAIDRDGNLNPGRDLNADVSRELAELSDDPEAKASAFGKLTGCCCFCNTALTDARSVEVGYGPVCAGNFGLNWGSKKREQEQLAA